MGCFSVPWEASVNDVYLRAAIRIEKGIDLFSCIAIDNAANCILTISDEAKKYKELFIVHENGERVFANKDERIMALLFMHQIANS